MPKAVYWTNNTVSFINKLKSRDPSIEPCGSPAITVWVVLGLLLTKSFCSHFLDNYTSESVHPLKNHKL